MAATLIDFYINVFAISVCSTFISKFNKLENFSPLVMAFNTCLWISDYNFGQFVPGTLTCKGTINWYMRVSMGFASLLIKINHKSCTNEASTLNNKHGRNLNELKVAFGHYSFYI